MSLLALVIYIVGYIVAWRAAFVYIFNDFARIGWGYKPEPDDIIMSSIIATLLSTVWPIWLVPMSLYRLLVKKHIDQWIEKNYGGNK